MAEVVSLLGRGGQRFAETVLGWNRGTIRKGLSELASGIPIADQYRRCGRKRAEDHLPNLLFDIESIVDPFSQADPTFRSRRIYSPLTASEIYRRDAYRPIKATNRQNCRQSGRFETNSMSWASVASALKNVNLFAKSQRRMLSSNKCTQPMRMPTVIPMRSGYRWTARP